MTAFHSQALPTPAPPKRVVTDKYVLGGQEIVSGTRIPAATILAYLRDGHSAAEIHQDYPALTNDGLRAVEAWAAAKFGPRWKVVTPSRPD